MINTLLGKVAGLYEKEFLFGSFVPALIFLSALAGAVAGVVGRGALWAWVDSWSATQNAVLTAVAGLVTVVFAYVLSALRPFFLEMWAGGLTSPALWPLYWLGRRAHHHRRARLETGIPAPTGWRRLFEDFCNQAYPLWDLNPAPIPPADLRALERMIQDLDRQMGEAAVRGRLDAILQALGQYSGESLSRVYRRLRDTIDAWVREEEALRGMALMTLDRSFGPPESVKSTGLGNVIDAYNAYPYTRYRIEAEMLWPRLRFVMKPEQLGPVNDRQTLLDFCLAMASLGCLFGLLAAVVGPWLWIDTRQWHSPALWYWGFLALGGFGAGWGFYRLAVLVAGGFGDLIRASFDLFRLDLMAALSRPDPRSLREEREQWAQLSRLAIYGTELDFPLRERKKA